MRGIGSFSDRKRMADATARIGPRITIPSCNHKHPTASAAINISRSFVRRPKATRQSNNQKYEVATNPSTTLANWALSVPAK